MESYNFDKVVSRIGSDSAKWAGFYHDTLAMQVADMDFPAPPEIIEALNTRLSHPFLGYFITPESYYDSMISWITKRHGYTPKKEWFVYAPGIISGFSMVIEALSNPMDGVIIEPPVYTPFFSVVEGQGRIPLANNLILKDGRYSMDFDDLERKAALPSTKLCFLCNPQNPVGRTWSRDELQTVFDICIRHNVIVMCDEIHGDLIYPGETFCSAASLSDETRQHVVTGFSPSKTFNIPGLRHGTLICPNDTLRDKINAIRCRYHLDGCMLGYLAAEAGFSRCEGWLISAMEYVKANHDYFENELKQRHPELQLTRPQGTYFAWIDFSGLGIEEEKLNDLLTNKLKLHLSPGRSYSEHYPDFRRMTLACPRSYVEAAVERLSRLV